MSYTIGRINKPSQKTIKQINRNANSFPPRDNQISRKAKDSNDEQKPSKADGIINSSSLCNKKTQHKEPELRRLPNYNQKMKMQTQEGGPMER